ncbi:MAG TPA: hypothetical protein GX700_12995 [Paracoccus sp.]|nr:hypothetical protein [Paracoccus sp. (in: a-proteobacteria)]
MAMALNRLAGFATVLVALALAAPGEARAETEDRSNDAQYAENCVIEYAKGASADSSFLERQMALRDRFDLDHDNIWLMAMLGDVSDIIPVEWIVDGLAECDRTFGFNPITEVINARPAIPQSPSMPQIADFDCAAAYWLRGAMYPMDQAAAGERAQFALGRYQAENAGLSVEQIIGQVQAAGNARYERIMHESRGLEELRQEMIADGQNPDEATLTERLQRRAVEARSFQQDIIACEAKYGFAQAGGQ